MVKVNKIDIFLPTNEKQVRYFLGWMDIAWYFVPSLTVSYWMGFEVLFLSISENFSLEKLKYIYKYRARVAQWGS
jgi:hypothetical protein